MTLEEKVARVEEVFEKLDGQIAEFQGWSGLHCPSGCGKCCFKADIEATIIEFLPFAFHTHQSGLAMEWLEKIKENDSSLCQILNPLQAGKGLCGKYKNRGLICRLFGYSARKNKYGVAELITCEIIKGQNKYSEASARVESGNDFIPSMHDYYLQLYSIDSDMARQFYPINQAIKKALEEVLHYYAYRNES
jgi:Fe-S-cluster containining protein